MDVILAQRGKGPHYRGHLKESKIKCFERSLLSLNDQLCVSREFNSMNTDEGLERRA